MFLQVEKISSMKTLKFLFQKSIIDRGFHFTSFHNFKKLKTEEICSPVENWKKPVIINNEADLRGLFNSSWNVDMLQISYSSSKKYRLQLSFLPNPTSRSLLWFFRFSIIAPHQFMWTFISLTSQAGVKEDDSN